MAKVAVIIAASGKGERFGAQIPKQFLKVKGHPVLAYSLAPFEDHPQVEEVLIATRPEWLAQVASLKTHYGWTKVSQIVAGGETRQDSVYQAFKNLSPEVEIVLVHDAARPLVTTELISRVIEGVKNWGAALCAIPVRDTVKEVSSQGRILRTLPREGLYLAQTPQGAWRGWLAEAYQKAQGRVYTDEASLLEAAGYEVYVVPGSFQNLKLTYSEDLEILEKCLPPLKQPDRKV